MSGAWTGGVVPGTTRALAAHYEKESVRFAEEARRFRIKAGSARTHAFHQHYLAEARRFSSQARDAAARAVGLIDLWRSGSKRDSPKTSSHHPTLPRSFVED